MHQGTSLEVPVNNPLYIPQVNTTTYGIKSIKYHCAKLWNDFLKTGKIQVKGVQEKNATLGNVDKLFRDPLAEFFR